MQEFPCVDAVQTAGKMGIAGPVHATGLDLRAQVRAPRGVGALAVDRGCRLSPIIREDPRSTASAPAPRTSRAQWVWRRRRSSAASSRYAARPHAPTRTD